MTRTLPLLGLILTLSLGAAAPPAPLPVPAPDDDADVRAVAAFVLQQVEKHGGHRLAVMPFSYLDGAFSVEGRLLADLLHLDLAGSRKVQLLERERLALIMQEHELGKMGMLDPARLPQLGQLAGVDLFVLGQCVDLGHQLQLTVRVVDVKSQILAQRPFPMQKRIKTPTTPLWEDIQKIKQANREQFGISVWTDKTTYTVGEDVVIKFKAERSCYVTIFNLGTSGQITVLFPNRFYATNYVKAGEEYSIPGRFQNFTIQVQGPAGLERLKIFATEANVPLLPQQYNVSAFRSLDPKDRSITRDLSITITNLDQTAWAEGSFEFEVKPKPEPKPKGEAPDTDAAVAAPNRP